MTMTTTHTCQCGFTWQHGMSGSHMCEPNYRERIAELTRERDALAAENAGLNKFIDDECYVYGPHDVEPVDAALEKPETPATDAAIANIKAQGVEMFAGSLRAVGGHAHPYSAVAIEFAAQLRKEAGNGN